MTDPYRTPAPCECTMWWACDRCGLRLPTFAFTLPKLPSPPNEVELDKSKTPPTP